MTTVPESALEPIFKTVIDTTHSKNDDCRRTAYRWFNRLYYDVRRWNKSFIEFLHTYPGFTDSKSLVEYDQFLNELQDYRDSLTERYGTVKYDLCTNLKMLSACYSRDFNWLYKKDENLYNQIRGLIDESYAREDKIIQVACSVCNVIINNIRNAQDHSKIIDLIRKYENASKQAVARLHDTADSAGIHLLDITEYEAIMNNEGSKNSSVMFLGETTMIRENIYTDQSRKVIVGRDLNLTDSNLNVGEISGTVTNAINQLPTSPDPDRPGIKEWLVQLQVAIEAESELSDEDKAEALDQVKTLAEAGQKPQDNALQKAAKTAMKILKGTVASLPDTAKLAESCAKLLPVIAALFALG